MRPSSFGDGAWTEAVRGEGEDVLDAATTAARVELSARLPADDSTWRESAREHATVPAARTAGRHPRRTNRGNIEAVVEEDEAGVRSKDDKGNRAQRHCAVMRLPSRD